MEHALKLGRPAPARVRRFFVAQAVAIIQHRTEVIDRTDSPSATHEGGQLVWLSPGLARK